MADSDAGLALQCHSVQWNQCCMFSPWGHGQQHIWYQPFLLLLRLAVFLCLWHLPWVRRAREPSATPGLRYRSNGGNSCSSVCKCLFKWIKEYKRLGGTSIWSSMESHRALLLDPFKECCSWDQKQWYHWETAALAEHWHTRLPEDVYWTSSSATSQSFLIERVGRKKLMGYGYLMMGVTMSVLTVTLSLKVNLPKR